MGGGAEELRDFDVVEVQEAVPEPGRSHGAVNKRKERRGT
jgi:hypothetical protein